MIRIGIDVGGTNTDAVAMEGREVRAAFKAPTSPDIASGVRMALERLLGEARLAPEAVGAVMIGTTQFTNAVVERRDLAPVAAVRLCLPSTAALPPFVDWPADMLEVARAGAWLTAGGHQFDGQQIAPLNEADLARIAGEIRASGAASVAVSAVFSPVIADHEIAAAEILSRLLPDLPVTCSHEIGRAGLLERENAGLLNAALRPLAARICGAFGRALAEAGLSCPFYLTQNDGTLLAAETAERFPILTVASGPTNSMRGAALLAGVEDGIVVDIGGTTSDVGILQKGFPRQSGIAVEVGGVRTNFRMPEVLSIGLGGGTIISNDDDPVIGPRSVGYRLTEAATVFGGDIVTATDIVVAQGRAVLGRPDRIAYLAPERLAQVQRKMDAMLDDVVDRARLSPEPLPVIVVGGGAILVSGPLAGQVPVEPPHHAVANAVGAAIAKISGETDRVYALDGMSRAEAIADATERARAAACAAGAIAGSLEVIEQEDTPLSYLPGQSTRIRVKVVGDLEGLA